VNTSKENDVNIHTLGLPRVGANRELKFALEGYWRGERSAESLQNTARSLRLENWQKQASFGVAFVTVNDFSLYDHVLDHSIMFGVVPDRFKGDDYSLDTYFRMARGQSQTGEEVAACDMRKWFDTNYHYIVPELSKEQTFSLNAEKLFLEIDEAQAAGFDIKPVLLGPVTLLWLSKTTYSAQESDKLLHLPALLECYKQLLNTLAERGVSWVQLDEPILTLELHPAWQSAITQSYSELRSSSIKLLLATYFGSVEHQEVIASLPVDGIHLDLTRSELPEVAWLESLSQSVISVGLIDGRNIWKTDLKKVIKQIGDLKGRFGDRIWASTSCSLLHVPVDLSREERLDSDLKSWLAFSDQKLAELSLIRDAFLGKEDRALLEENSAAIKARKSSKKVNRFMVTARCKALSLKDAERLSAYPERAHQQKQALNLPLFPTTTIGSFPQTPEIRQARSGYRKGELSETEYQEIMRSTITDVIQKQESIGLDLLVHGEAERNDMVEYFGELLEGYAATEFGWVQSYGSRCVKPPIIFGDVERSEPMTVEWATFAQSQASKPVKGMLTGPVTMQQWAFVRDDIPRSQVALQIALAIRDEVCDLEAAGIKAIQIDEPAIREGLPLKLSQWQEYLDWAVFAFKVSSCGVADATQIHTHMCYSKFDDIVNSIIALDADVITIETARSEMALLDAFVEHKYPNEMGPGVFDIHSPVIPSTHAMELLLQKALRYLPEDRLWVNPDCGLKTRQWAQVQPSLERMVAAAKSLRLAHQEKVA
jgi:5-methyltetrahydropteroyltriglutamate--homocysteine methyltransferase